MVRGGGGEGGVLRGGWETKSRLCGYLTRESRVAGAGRGANGEPTEIKQLGAFLTVELVRVACVYQHRGAVARLPSSSSCPRGGNQEPFRNQSHEAA